MSGDARIEPYGEAAWLVSFPAATAAAGARRAHRLADLLGAGADGAPPIAGLTTVLVRFDPLGEDGDPTRTAIEQALASVPADPPADPAARVHRIEVRYGGADGPDLDEVGRATGRTPDEVVARHAGATYEVLMLGFAPGFAYLGELDPVLHLPRLATPRARVPPGSVAIADAYTGIYPAALPGGWRLIGRTDHALFDPRAAEPAVLRAGDQVRFVPG